jgi:hypothetical protein
MLDGCGRAGGGEKAMARISRLEPRGRSGPRRLTGALLAAACLALAPAARAEEAPLATAVLWELAEYIDCNPGPAGPFPEMPADCSNVSSQGFGTRIADAYLRGFVSGPSDSPLNGTIETDAASILSKVDWTGPAHGKLRINDGAVHAVFSGQLNLSMAMLWGKPLAPISGNWTGTKGTYHGGGRLEGLFLIPFPGGAAGRTEPWVYLALDASGRPSGDVTPLRDGSCTDPDPAARGDYFNGMPMVKLVVTFFQN